MPHKILKLPYIPTTFLQTFSDFATRSSVSSATTFVTSFRVSPCTITSWRVIIGSTAIPPAYFDFTFRIIGTRTRQDAFDSVPDGAALFSVRVFPGATVYEKLEYDIEHEGQYLQVVVTNPAAGVFSTNMWVSVSVLPWENGSRPNLRPKSRDRKKSVISGSSVHADGVFAAVSASRFIGFPFIIRSFWWHSRGVFARDLSFQLVPARDRDLTVSRNDSIIPLIFNVPILNGFGSPHSDPNNAFPVVDNTDFPLRYAEIRPWYNVIDPPVSIKVYSHKNGFPRSEADWLIEIERLPTRPWWAVEGAREGFSFDHFTPDYPTDLILEGLLSLEDLPKLVGWEILVRGALTRVLSLFGARIPDWPVFDRPRDSKLRMKQIQDIHQFFISLLVVMGIPIEAAIPGLLVTAIGPTPLEIAGVAINQWVLDVVVDSYTVVKDVMIEARHSDEVERPGGQVPRPDLGPL